MLPQECCPSSCLVALLVHIIEIKKTDIRSHKQKRMGKFFTLIILLILSSNLITAQDSIIEHPIEKGESVYSISKKYGVTMEAIFELNPGSEDVIYAGNTLRVPNSSNSNTSSSSSAVITDTKIQNYKVKRGETKSGLSRRFGVSIAQLEQQNPHIISMLQAGHIINIDKTLQVKQTVNEGEHLVVKGETLWGISKRYGVSLDQLINANADNLSEYLQIGQILRIPDKNEIATPEGEYLVKRGDTKFSLAKRFNMSIAELEEKNPHIVKMLMAGHVLDISKSDDSLVTVDPEQEEEEEVEVAEGNNTLEETTPIENEETTPVEETVTETDTTSTTETKAYKNYVIEPQETLYGLSKKAGMTIEEFTELNPKLLDGVIAGDIIKMPINPTEETVDSNPEIVETTDNNTNTETDTNTTTETELKNRNEALYTNLDTSGTSGLYFYTPFSGKELSSPELREKMLNKNVDNYKYLDFFQGAQIAIDSALSLSINFDITVIKESNINSQLEIESSYTKNALLVPFLKQGATLPKITSNQSIAIIDIESNLPSTDNKIYKSIPSENFQKTETLNYIANKNANVIVVSELDEPTNKTLILNKIPEAKFLKVDNAGFFKEQDLQEALDKNKLNFVILDSKKTILFLNSTTSLMSKLSEYNIQLALIDSSLIPEENEVSDMRYRVLKLVFPTAIDQKNTKLTSDFETKYESLFEIKPSRYAILGYNITLDVLLRLSQNQDFENTINEIKSEHSHVKFDYKKTSNTLYSNSSLFLMQYDSNNGMIELEKDK